MLVFFGLTIIFPIIISLVNDDGNIGSFLFSLLITILAGLFLYLPNKKCSNDIKTKEGFLIVVLFWVVLSAFASIPFILDPYLQMSFADAFFESVSGWTTTGATVINNLDSLPMSILMYRQQLQWLGGVGIVILVLAILPILGVGGMQLYKAESTGPIKDNKISPKITETAKNLWSVYLGLTFVCALLYYFAGMSAFDAIAHSFSTIAIGGFSTHNESIGYFNNIYIEVICMTFMLLSAMNFVLHFMSLKTKSIRHYLEDSELKSYISIILIFIIFIFLHSLLSNNNETSFRHIVFQIISFITTSGFTTADYSIWPSFIFTMLILMSFIGACAGSTGGGIKVMRILLILKLTKKELLKIIHPSAEIPIRINNTPLSDDIAPNVWNFFILYVISYLVISFVLLAGGLDLTTAFSAVASCMNNLGPALGDVANTYSSLGSFEKYILAFAMLLGRLELLTLLIVFTPYFWKY